MNIYKTAKTEVKRISPIKSSLVKTSSEKKIVSISHKYVNFSVISSPVFDNVRGPPKGRPPYVRHYAECQTRNSIPTAAPTKRIRNSISTAGLSRTKSRTEPIEVINQVST